MLGHRPVSNDTSKQLSMHGSSSPEIMRPSLTGLKSRTNQLQYQSPQEITSNPYSPATITSSGTYSGNNSASGADNFGPGNGFKRSNSDTMSRGNESLSNTPGIRPQRHASFGVLDAKSADFPRPLLQTAAGPYGLLSSASSSQNYHGSHVSPQAYVNQQNFPPFSLPPPTFSPTPTSAFPPTPISTAPLQEPDPVYSASMPTEYHNEGIHHQQSGPDMMLLDQMTAPNTMPVFGGEGYNRSPFAIPEDFVAYLFSGQQIDGSSPVGPIGQHGYAKSVKTLLTSLHAACKLD